MRNSCLNYINTYLHRDVRTLLDIKGLTAFHRFIKMCAVRSGQILNLTSLANDCGITHNTAKSWLSVLEASFIAFTLQPHHKNFNKRLIKAPKLYLYDTGLVCALLGIEKPEQLITHPSRGAIFETWVISELIKQRFNQGKANNLFYWRDNTGNEVDSDLPDTANKYVIYAGDSNQPRSDTKVLGWQSLTNIDEM